MGYDNTKYTFTGSVSNNKFEFEIKILVVEQIKIFTDTENRTSDGCKSNIKDTSDSFTHFGMSRENLESNKDL